MATEVLVTTAIGLLALIIFGFRQTKMEQHVQFGRFAHYDSYDDDFITDLFTKHIIISTCYCCYQAA